MDKGDMEISPLYDAGPAVPSTSAATDPPDANTVGLRLSSYNAVRAAFVYTGSVTAAEVAFWIKTRAGWVLALSTTDDVALAPTGKSAEIRDYQFGAPTTLYPQVVSVTGGEVAVYLDGVNIGA